MTFFSQSFFLLVVVTTFLYYLPLLRRYQVHLLVIASLVFYLSAQYEAFPVLLATLLGTCFFLYRSGNKKYFLYGLVFNLLILAFFKYKFLFMDATQSTGGKEYANLLDYLILLPLPVGISFFVFHNISLLTDFREQIKRYADQVERPSLNKVALYIIFFPQLVSGPITRFKQFFPQIVEKKWVDVNLVGVTKHIVIGAFMKLFVANNSAQITLLMEAPNYSHLNSLDRVLLAFMYSIQIYADFFGYSSIAIGLALLFGYRLPINFNLPYISSSFSDFWHRWHISLSSWLRNYLYFPLGGNRLGKARTYVNLMVVMSIGGLWHGASMGYMLWGAVHGGFLVIERVLKDHFSSMVGSIFDNSILALLRAILVFTCVSFAWIFFKLPTFGDSVGYLHGIFIDTDLSPSLSDENYIFCLLVATPVIIQHLFSGLTNVKIWASYLQPIAYSAMLFLAVFKAGPDTPFIYFQF